MTAARSSVVDGRFRLDLSMLERLGNNGVACADLSHQRRMRPQICRLLVPLYPTLGGADRASVHSQFPPIRGIERAVFFLKHEKHEAAEAETHSRSNSHEARFVAALAAYLLRQGYAPSQITILTPYCGQQLLIRRELHEQPRPRGLPD